MTTIDDTLANRIQSLGATLRTNARMGRQPYPDELLAMGDELMRLAAGVRAMAAGNAAAAELAEIETRVSAARLQ